MTNKKKLDLIQKYEDLPDEEFKDSYFEKLKKFASDKDDTVKVFTSSVLSRFADTAKQQEAIDILLQLCHERNALVRTEAYDAIGCYFDQEVITNLENAILSEKNGLARSYAIDSWIYIQQHLYPDCAEVIAYLDGILEEEKDDYCILNCLYGKYSFGERNILDNILSYTESEDYHIRCSVLSVISLILEDKNCTEQCRAKIITVVTELLWKEKTKAVRECAEEIIKRLEHFSSTL